MPEDKQFIKAKDCAYRLLSYRQRSIAEVVQRLKRKGFALSIIQRTVEHLQELKLLNDQEFARFWIRSKTAADPVGWSLLRYQLKQKGVATEIIQQAALDFQAEHDEFDLARRLVASRRKRYLKLNPQKRKKRLYDYLRRRGFNQAAIYQALNKKVA